MKEIPEKVKTALYMLVGLFVFSIFARAFYWSHVVFVFEAIKAARDWSVLALAAFFLSIAWFEHKRKGNTAIACVAFAILFVFIWCLAWAITLIFHWP
jgi:hypothetical protein